MVRQAHHKMAAKRYYVIRKDDSDWTPIVAVVTGPKTPALSTMEKRFDEQFSWPPNTVLSSAEAIYNHIAAATRAAQRVMDAGYKGHSKAEAFLDWLLKTDSRFERVKFDEVSL